MFIKTNPIVFFTAVVLLAIGVTLAWNLTARAAYESAEYRVVETDGEFEIRDYPDLVLVSTQSSSTFQGSDGSFMRLFRYISGNNTGDQKVAMTTPVFMEGKEDASNGTMAFVIPKEVALRGAPMPAAADVQLRTRKGGRFAVLRFSGRMDAESAERASKRLRDWVSKRGLQTDPDMEYAGYDPPWTPGPLRRNEALVRVVDQSDATSESNPNP